MNIILSILSESLKLFIEMSPYLLLGLIFVGLLNTYVNPNFINKQLGKNSIYSIIKAALFGVPLPLCSCGVIPTGVFLLKNNSSKPAVTSFLISTPQTGVDSIIATYGMMGPIFAIFRPFAALFMGIFGGLLVKIFVKEEKKKFIALNVLENKEEKKSTFETLIKYPFFTFLKDISPQLLFGVLLAGIISYSFPESFFQNYNLGSGFLGMLTLIIVGIPMYICATASIPIALVLMSKGVSAGLAFVFLAVGPVTNFASFTILSKSLGKKTLIIYTISIIISAMFFGYLLDIIIYYFKLDYKTDLMHIHNHSADYLSIISAIILGSLLLISIYQIYFSKLFKSKIKLNENEIVITGMTCSRCENTVKDTLVKNGYNVLKIDHITGIVTLDKLKDIDKIDNLISDIGYKLKR